MVDEIRRSELVRLVEQLRASRYLFLVVGLGGAVLGLLRHLFYEQNHEGAFLVFVALPLGLLVTHVMMSLRFRYQFARLLDGMCSAEDDQLVNEAKEHVARWTIIRTSDPHE